MTEVFIISSFKDAILLSVVIRATMMIKIEEEKQDKTHIDLRGSAMCLHPREQ